jgi:predicted nucleotidyltransferase
MRNSSAKTGRRRIQRMFDDAAIQEAGRRLLKTAPAGSRVILFGSHARGQAGEHSDLDFLVIEPEVEDVVQESVRLHRALQRGVYADVIVRSEESVREWRDVYGTVINSALREGRELAA